MREGHGHMRLLRFGFLATTTMWAAALPLATLAAGQRGAGTIGYTLAFVVYAVGSVVCHQLPERSFHLFAVQMPVCARCTGIYFGGALTVVLFVLARDRQVREVGTTGHVAVRARSRIPTPLGQARKVLIASAVPTALTILYEIATGSTPANWLRAMSGAPLGAAAAWVACWIGKVN
jgi:hypothetical protein